MTLRYVAIIYFVGQIFDLTKPCNNYMSQLNASLCSIIINCVLFFAAIQIMFSMAIFSFAENVVGGQGFVDIVSNLPAARSFSFNVNGGKICMKCLYCMLHNYGLG